MIKKERGSYAYSEKREECKSKCQKKEKQERKGGSDEFKTTAVILNQIRSVTFWVATTELFCTFQTLPNTEQGQS